MQTIKIMTILAAAAAEVYGEGANRRLVISVPDRKMALIEDGRVVKVFPVAVGKPGTPSPHGVFHIASRVVNPSWYQPGKVVGPGPANPLGTRWMGLGFKGYGIHGTNRPSSIGHASSHGCIRMRIPDVEELFELVQVGDEVDLLNEVPPDLAAVFGAPQPAQVAALASNAAAGGGQ